MKSKSNVTILVVDDEEVDRRAVKRALTKNRISNPTIEAENGQMALDLLKANAENSVEPPYIVLLDLNMPIMDGHELLAKIRDDKALRKSIIFVLTTSDDELDRNRAYDKNVAGYMVKNRVEDDFLEKVQMLDKFMLNIEFPG